MKQILTLTLILGMAVTAFSQQIPLYTQYLNNPFTINPAYAGSVNKYEIKASYRAQWVDFPTAPVTAMLSATGGFKRAGFGLLAFNDEAGSLTRNGILGAYAYHIPLNEKYKMSIGLSMKYLQYRLNTRDIEDKLILDGAIQSAANGRGRFDGTLGFYFYDENLYVGLSAPNLIQTKFEQDGVSESNLSDVTEHFFALVGYKFDFGDIDVEPSILARKIQAAPFQFETNLKIWFLDEQLMVGGSYRTSERTIAPMFGIVMDRRFRLFYAYELSFNSIAPYNFGSHEFTVGLDINQLDDKKGYKVRKR